MQFIICATWRVVKSQQEVCLHKKIGRACLLYQNSLCCSVQCCTCASVYVCVCVCVFFMTYWSVVNLCFVEGDKKLQTYLQSRKSVSPREWGKGRCERHNVCSLRFSQLCSGALNCGFYCCHRTDMVSSFWMMSLWGWSVGSEVNWNGMCQQYHVVYRCQLTFFGPLISHFVVIME